MNTVDGRSVGEVLLEAEQVARDLPHEAPSLDGRAMVRTRGEVIDAAAEFWDGLPPGRPVPGQVRVRAVDIMDQLRHGAVSLHRRDALAISSATYDERLLTLSEAFARAAQLLTNNPQTVRTFILTGVGIRVSSRDSDRSAETVTPCLLRAVAPGYRTGGSTPC